MVHMLFTESACRSGAPEGVLVTPMEIQLLKVPPLLRSRLKLMKTQSRAPTGGCSASTIPTSLEWQASATCFRKAEEGKLLIGSARQTAGEQMSMKLNAAYEALMNPEARRAYNLTPRKKRSPVVMREGLVGAVSETYLLSQPSFTA